MKNITIATTENIGYYSLLVDSCKKNNIELVVLGLGEKWTGFTMRFKLWLEYLNTLNDDEIVMMNDAYDVIILEDSEKILNKYNNFKKPLVFGNQCGINEYFIKRTKYTLCFGNIIGSVKYIKYVINILNNNPDLWKKFHNDDQIILNHLYEKNDDLKNIIDIDINNDIFFIASDIDRISNINYLLYGQLSGLKMENNQLLNDSNKPISVLHLPANMNGNLYLNYIGYDTSNININIENYKFNQIYGIYHNIINIIIVLIVLLIITMLCKKYFKNSTKMNNLFK